MANLNKVMLIGRLTRDVETRAFGNGGKVASFGFAVNNRKKNQQSGQWEDVPVYIDCDVFNRGEFGKKADLAEQYLAKGRQVYLEGHLVFDQWDDKTTGQKRSKLKLVVDEMQFLDSGDRGGQGGQSGGQSGGMGGGRRAPQNESYGEEELPGPGPGPSPNEEITF